MRESRESRNEGFPESYTRPFREGYRQARHYYDEGAEAVSHRVGDAPLLPALAVGALGIGLVWALSRSGESSGRNGGERRRDLPGQLSGNRLIESDRVEGTAVYDPDGHRIGTVEHVMIDKLTGHVAYAVLSFGGFLGFGRERHAIPWRKLDYDPTLEGYRTDITEEQLRRAPGLTKGDRQREQALHDHYGVTYYWILA